MGVDLEQTTTLEARAERRATWLRGAALGAASVGLVVVMLRLTPQQLASTLPNDPGDPNFVIWLLRWGSRSLVTEPWNVFDAPIFWPDLQTLGLSDTLLSLAPFYGLLELVTGNPVLALNLLSIALYELSLVSTYLLGRWLLGSRGASIAMAVAFTFTSYSLGQQSHVQLLMFGLFPLGLLLLLRFLDAPGRAGAVSLAAVTVAFFYGATLYALLWLIVAPVVVVVLLVLGLRPVRAHLVNGAAAVAGALVVCAPVLFLYASVSEEHGVVRTYDGIDPFLIRDLLTPSAANWFWGDRLSGINSAGVAGDRGFMMSMTVYALAGLGAVSLVRAHRARAARGANADAVAVPSGRVDRSNAILAILVAAAGSFVAALGPTVAESPAPYRILYKFVPGFDGIRVTSRLAIVGMLGIALLAAVGVRWILASARARSAPRWVAVGVVGAVTAMMLVEVAIVDPQRYPAWDRPEVAAVYDELAGRPDGVVLELPIFSSPDLFTWPFVEAPRMALSVGDGHPRINGYSGHWPNGFVEDAVVLGQFPSPAALARAEELGVRYVVVHTLSPWPAAPVDPVQVDAILDGLPDGATLTRHGEAWLIDLFGSQDDAPGLPAAVRLGEGAES